MLDELAVWVPLVACVIAVVAVIDWPRSRADHRVRLYRSEWTPVILVAAVLVLSTGGLALLGIG